VAERIVFANAAPPVLNAPFDTNMVNVSGNDKGIAIVNADVKTHNCERLEIAKGRSRTVAKFLVWKREEREREYEQELFSLYSSRKKMVGDCDKKI
jgi:hypothetical protein